MFHSLLFICLALATLTPTRAATAQEVVRTAAPLGTAAPASSADSGWIERERLLMGTRLTVRLQAESRAAALAVAEAVFEEVARLESVLSSWSSDSELGRVNHAPPLRETVASHELTYLLKDAARWAEATGGAFDPAIGALVDAWGIRTGGRLPSDEELEAALAASGIEHFEIYDGLARRTNQSAWIDAGGFGKGAALNAARTVAERAGISAGMLDFGGQLLLLGRQPSSETVAVADPRSRSQAAATIKVGGGSVATTSLSEKRFFSGGEDFGHILDPRTGRPAAAWGSVTVVAEDAMEADLLATALFVMGPESGLKWAEKTGVSALFLNTSGDGIEVTWTSGLDGAVELTGHSAR
ncbi:MAG: FAD:protein FMN transferase [Gemmatimonadota bacterium]